MKQTPNVSPEKLELKRIKLAAALKKNIQRRKNATNSRITNKEVK